MDDSKGEESPKGDNQIQIHGDAFDNQSAKVRDVVKAIYSSEIVRSSKAITAIREETIPLGRARCLLPLSGHKIRVKQHGKKRFSIRSTYVNETPKIWNYDSPKGKHEDLNEDQLKSYLKLLHLTQLTLLAHTERPISKKGVDSIALPMAVVDAAKSVEDFLRSESDDIHSEIGTALENLEDYHRDWVKKFHEAVEKQKIVLNRDVDDDLYNDSYERKFIRLPQDKHAIQPRDYFDELVSDSITAYVQDILFHGLEQMYSIPTPQNLKTDVGWQMPLIELRLGVKGDLYEQPKLEARRLLSLIGYDQKQMELKQKVEGILKKTNNAKKIRALLDDPPATLNRSLEAILMEGDFGEVIQARLESLVPGIVDFERKNSEKDSLDMKELFSKTEDVRNEIENLENLLSRIDGEIDSLRGAKDTGSDVNPLQIQWANQRKELTSLKNEPQSIEKTKQGLKDRRKELGKLALKMKKVRSNTSTEGSVLWLGLGQAGQAILRECLLYCLDNLNDARCGALIESLGVSDLNELKANMLASKQSDVSVRTDAEHALRGVFDRDLHVLAMNLGGEVDDLVEPDAPGYFLWGEKKVEAEYSSVRRKTKNTIKLDTVQNGTGGTTGIGRAFAFARDNEIEEALAEVGRKNNNSPTHIIVTHSFPGGSGSGMILPVLQLLRKQFDADAMIWVISVGEGNAEERDTAKFNTPFILSDILQAHYDGIHSTIDPFKIGQWAGFKMEMEGHHSRMKSILKELSDSIGENDNILESIEKIDLTKGRQLSKNRELHQARFNSLLELEKFPAKFKMTLSGRETTELALGHDNQGNWDYDFAKLVNYLPLSDEHTEEFNLWCDEYDSNGERPALKYWSWWVNQASDPLGTLVDCRMQSKQQRNHDAKDEEAGFVPHITSAHIAWAIERLEMKLFGKVETDTSERTEKIPENEPPSIRMLVNYLHNQLSTIEEPEKLRPAFEVVEEKLQSYSREVDGYNAIRRNLTIRVRALSKAGNDEAIKNIIISNSHLERGVSNSQIPVEENTYTVYNAVVFDVIMNIIGSQLPSSDFQKGKMEYFDREDLSRQTKPPMVVGLLQQNDALSLAEPPVADRDLRIIVRKMGTNIGITEIFDRLFITRDLFESQPNPFSTDDFRAGGWASYFFSAFFGIRSHYMLQFNPYDLSGITPSPKLKSITDTISRGWNDEAVEILGYSFEERQALERSNITSLSLVNMIRWITLVELETLSKWMKVEFQDEIKKLMPLSRPDFKFAAVQGNFQLTAYEQDSGDVNMGRLGKIFCDLGLFTEELLAAAPPSLLSSYLPYMILQNRRTEIEDSIKKNLKEKFHKKCIGLIEILSSQYQPTTSYDRKLVEKLMPLIESIGQFETMLNVLGNFNLSIQFGTDREGNPEMNLRLHPKLSRYLSVFRDVVLNPGSALFPSKSAAGNLSRYLMPDTPDDVIDVIGSPTFVRATSALKRMGFIGLLPDEQRFTWPSFCRMVLFSNQDKEVFLRNMVELAKVSGTELSRFEPLLAQFSQESDFDISLLGVDSGPDSIVELGRTLHRRLLASKGLSEEYRKQHPDEAMCIDHWEERIDAISGEDIEIFDRATLLFFAQFLLNEVAINDNNPGNKKTKPTVENAGPNAPSDGVQDDSPAESMSRDDIVSSDRLLYELAFNLNEMLTQAEYMSKDHSADRVHFQMNGFSDRLVGVPNSLLIQVHTASTYREDFDAAKLAIRNSIKQCLGPIQSSKEFQTKSVFGPRASVTMTLAQAPLNEASSKYRQIMRELAGNSPNSYLEKAALHPYVFLYNILWLSARIDKWTNAENITFARRFVIPLQVIQTHYSHPEGIEGSVGDLVRQDVFKSGLAVPQVDIRDYKSSRNAGERYRSMLNLLAIVALRHVKACESLRVEHESVRHEFAEVEVDEHLSKLILDLRNDPLINRYSDSFSKGKGAYSLLAQNERVTSNKDDGDETRIDDGVNDIADGMGIDDLIGELTKDDEDDWRDDPASSDTIVGRTKAWLKAYESWKKWTTPKKDEAE